MDLLTNSRRIKVLTIVDDFTREFVDLAAEHDISFQDHTGCGCWRELHSFVDRPWRFA
jgi:putative transposase